MNEEEKTWQIEKADLSIKIASLLKDEDLDPIQALETLINCMTTTFIALKYQIPEEDLMELFDCCVENLKKEFKDKMEFFKSKPDMNYER